MAILAGGPLGGLNLRGAIAPPLEPETTAYWTPLEISPDFWLDASQVSSLTVDGSSQVTSWASRVGSLTLTVAGGASPLIYSATEFNGYRPVSNASSVGRTMRLALGSTINIGSCVVFAVFRSDSTVGQLFDFRNATDENPLLDDASVAGFGIRTRSALSASDISSALVTSPERGQWTLGCWRFVSGGTSQIFINGAQLSTFAYTRNISVNRVGILCNGFGPDTGPTARLADFSFYNGLNSQAEIDKLFGYHAHKWNLQGLLPMNHPYKTNPPLL